MKKSLFEIIVVYKIVKQQFHDSFSIELFNMERLNKLFYLTNCFI